MAKQSRSKRKYPERVCANNSCAYVRIFIPHDKRQEYCCVQCRTDHNNDLRASINNTRFLNERLLRLYDRKLEKIYNRWVNSKGYCAVFKGYLEHEEIDLRFATQEERNISTNGKTRWFYNFGVEMHPKSEGYFIVHKRTSNNRMQGI